MRFVDILWLVLTLECVYAKSAEDSGDDCVLDHSVAHASSVGVGPVLAGCLSQPSVVRRSAEARECGSLIFMIALITPSFPFGGRPP